MISVARTDSRETSRVRTWAPCLFLLVFTPVEIDLLFGAFTWHTIIALAPTVVTYGVAALLIRGVAARRGVRWSAVVILGVAFTVIAECLIVQTSLSPSPDMLWGRAAGVNWVYLVWTMGYFGVSGFALSIQLVDLVFPNHRGQPLLTTRGMIIAAVVFAVGSVQTSINWTHNVEPKLTNQPVYHPPTGYFGVAAIVASVLITIGWLVARRSVRSSPASEHAAPRPPHVFLVALFVSGMWFVLLTPEVTGGAIKHLPPVLAIALAVGLAAAVVPVVRNWSHGRNWSDRHRLALVAGALTTSMGLGFVVNANHLAATSDLLFKIVLDMLTVVGLLILAYALRYHRGAVR